MQFSETLSRLLDRLTFAKTSKLERFNKMGEIIFIIPIKNIYTDKAFLNGVQIDKPFISYQQIMDGGT